MIGVGVVGYGYWGPNLVRNLHEVPGCRVVGVADGRPARLDLVRQRYPAVTTYPDIEDLLADRRVDAVAIATPVHTHFELAMRALKTGRHVLVEKPMASSSDQAARLVDEAACRRLVLAVDHTFVYTGAVRRIKQLVDEGALGDIYYYDSVRVNLGLFQHDVSVVWDLAVHDLSIMDYVLPSRPCAVSATGLGHVEGEPENIAYLTLFFTDRVIAHVHVNWLAPVKVRRTLIGGSQKMVVFDDLEPSEKIKVYDKGITLNGTSGKSAAAPNGNGEKRYQMLVGYRTGDMWAPQIDLNEALCTELREFVAAVAASRPPLSDGHAGLRVVRMLEAATESMENRGRVVELADERCVA
jgi:predicted dehydrogenase